MFNYSGDVVGLKSTSVLIVKRLARHPRIEKLASTVTFSVQPGGANAGMTMPKTLTAATHWINS